MSLQSSYVLHQMYLCIQKELQLQPQPQYSQTFMQEENKKSNPAENKTSDEQGTKRSH